MALEVVHGQRIADEVCWGRGKMLDLLADEHVELHEQLQTALATRDDPSVARENQGCCVEHPSNGVCVQNSVQVLDVDA